MTFNKAIHLNDSWTAASGFVLNAQQDHAFGTGTSFTGAGFTAAANVINVVAVTMSGSSTLSITDSLGSTYTPLVTAGTFGLYAATVTAPQSGNTLIFTLGTSQSLSYVLGAFTGANMVSPIDVFATQGTGSSPVWSTDTSPTTLIGAMVPNNGQISTIVSPWEMISPTGSYAALVYNRNVATNQTGATFSSTGDGGFANSGVSALK